MFSNVNSLKLIAHRANSGSDVPENSLSAVRAAHEFGLEWVECDAQLTDDGVLIVMHDHTLERTTNAVGKDAKKSISEMKYSELIKFNLTSKVSKKLSGEKAPPLSEFLGLIKELNMGLLLEIKSVVGLERKTTQETVKNLEKNDFLNYPKLMIQSFFMECIEEVKALNDTIPRCLLIEEWEILTRDTTRPTILKYPSVNAYKRTEPIEDILPELQCTALATNHTILDQERVIQIKEKLKIPILLAWTVNSPKRAEELYEFGVDSVISDNPILIQKNLKAINSEIAITLKQFDIPFYASSTVSRYLGLFSFNDTEENQQSNVNVQINSRSLKS